MYRERLGGAQSTQCALGQLTLVKTVVGEARCEAAATTRFGAYIFNIKYTDMY